MNIGRLHQVLYCAAYTENSTTLTMFRLTNEIIHNLGLNIILLNIDSTLIDILL